MSTRSKKNPVSSPPPAPSLPPLPAPAPPADGLFWEERVAAELGIARARLRSLREQHLTLDTHFILRRGTVVLTQSGLEKINAVLAAGTLPAPSPESPATAKETAFPVPSGPPARAEFIIAMVPPNPRLLVCRRGPGLPSNQIVRVKSNALFLPGMKVPVIAAGHGWQVYGRLPRRKGKW